MAKATKGGDKPSDPLRDLLTSLATGARAVNGIPVEDDYSFQASFPEFAEALQAAQDSLRGIVFDILEDQTDIQNGDEIDDPFLLEKAADLCDLLMEELESYLQRSSKSGQALQEFSQSARIRSQKSFSAMKDGIVEMEKPQKAYGIKIAENRRGMPFIPRVHPKKPHGKTPLDLSLKEGSGWETRFAGTKSPSSISPDMILPKQHVPHPYETEIKTFQYTSSQLQSPLRSLPSLPMPKGPSPLPFSWVDTPSALDSLAKRLKSVNEIAIDLEAHNYRSFSGICCLMQISIRDNKAGAIESFLVDTLALHGQMNAAFASPLADPAIVKVFHGADSDIAWLQRDFGLYVVNLFDTGRAARALKLSSASYAHLLMRYFGIQADKSYQLADWRQRPLPSLMQEYAVQDTYYLLTIYDCLRFELDNHRETSIEQVFDISRQVSLIRYTGEGFRTTGYHTLMGRSRRSKTEHRLTPKQEATLAALWDWRDSVARRMDESVAFILPNDSLWRLALSIPTSLTALQALFQPFPPHLLSLSSELLSTIKDASAEKLKGTPDASRVDDDEDEEEDDDLDEDLAVQRVPSSSSAFFKPTPTIDRQRRGMMSPVLGTEALYKQAGWMTPQEVVSVGTSTTDNDEKDGTTGKPKRLLSVHSSNAHFNAKQVSSHSLEISSSDVGRGRTADGMATVRAAREASGSPRPSLTEEDVVKTARQSSAQIRSATLSKEAIPGVLGVLAHTSTSSEIDEEEEEEGQEDGENAQKVENEADDFVIPRSIREIYKISNRNRRNKKVQSPTPERGVTPTSDKEREELAKAEALLKEKGNEALGYLFDQSPNSPKRPRTKSTGGSEGSPAPEGASASKEEDLGFMREIGWIPDEQTNESILSQQYGDSSPTEETNKNPYYEYAPVAMSSAAASSSSNTNPFFGGAAMQGGALAAAASQKPRKSDNTGSSNNNKSSGGGGGGGGGGGSSSGGGGGRGGNSNRLSRHRQGERPEKKDGRSFAYRGKR